MKTLILATLLVIFCGVLMGEELGIYVDSNRFFGTEKTNIVEINYAVPYSAVDFMEGEYGWEAEVFVEISVLMGEKQVSSDSFTNKIITRDQTKIYGDELYLDKISFTLPRYNFLLEVQFTDIHTEVSYKWEEEFTPLSEDGLVSDLELSSYIEADSTSRLEKFHRKGNLYMVRPDQTFSRELGKLAYYQNLGNVYSDGDGNYRLQQEVIFKKGDEVLSSANHELTGNLSDGYIQGEIDISMLEEGYYDLEINYRDMISGAIDQVEDYICLKEIREEVVRLFPDLEDDVLLAKYFMNTNEKSVLRTLSEEGQQNYISRFWKSRDFNPATPENEFTYQTMDRVKYANQYYTHFKPGWKSDRGRIHIKYGKPYEISKHTTNLGENDYSTWQEMDSEESLQARINNRYTVKNYVIWKYRLGKERTYIFIDKLTNGNFELIYSSDDDDGETTVTDWESYLGADFDERLLD